MAEAERRCAGRLSINGFRHISSRLETEEYQTLALPSRSKPRMRVEDQNPSIIRP